MPSYASEIRERLTALVEPLREEERKVDSRITELELELAELRPLRTELRRQVRAITGEPPTNGDGKTRKGSKTKLREGATGHGISEERLDAIVAWLGEHHEDYPDGFVGSELVRIPDFPMPPGGQSTTARGFRILQERGVLVLDHVGGSGRAKHYKLTSAVRMGR